MSILAARDIAILDAEIIGIDPVYPDDAILQLVRPCPFCQQLHRHGDSKTVAVGTLLHRSAHCVSDRPKGRGRYGVAPNLEYMLRVVCNPFVDETEVETDGK